MYCRSVRAAFAVVTAGAYGKDERIAKCVTEAVRDHFVGAGITQRVPGPPLRWLASQTVYGAVCAGSLSSRLVVSLVVAVGLDVNLDEIEGRWGRLPADD